MDLSSFLAQNALKAENVKYVASNRFLDGDGKPIEWEITCITPAEDETLRKSCTKRVPVPGKKMLYTPETDYNEYACRLAARCTLYPNLSDIELQESYKVMGAEALLKAMLTPGEYVDYIGKVQEANGFDKEQEEIIEEAKN